VKSHTVCEDHASFRPLGEQTREDAEV